VQEPFWRKHPLETLKLFQQICEGIAEAHNNNIIHRDIKPENIFLRTATGPAVIADFGICFLQDEQERLTMLDENVGTKKYMSPETEDGKIPLDEITNKSDIYSLGKVLYWLFAGKVFNREKQRDSHWDLKIQLDDMKMEYINILLDKMIIENAAARITINDVINEVYNLIRLFEGKFNMIIKGVPQHCIYCGIGTYENLAKTTKDAKTRFGIAYGMQTSSQEFRAFACNNCGNLQSFRVDLCKNKDWLDK
jgi:serine/threonine protein kinase